MGDEDVALFRLLRQDHREVDRLLAQLGGTDSPDRREVRFPRVKTKLLAHAKAEEKTFYRALQAAGVKRGVKHAKREHEEIEAAIRDLDALDYADDGWVDALMKLHETVQHHVDEEEGEIFDRARDELEPDELAELAVQFERQKLQELDSLGVPREDGLDELTKNELLEELEHRGIHGGTSMTRDELLSTLRGGAAS